MFYKLTIHTLNTIKFIDLNIDNEKIDYLPRN